MTKEQFGEILREYGFTKDEITKLWDSRPSGELDEQTVRDVAKDVVPFKHLLR